MSNQNHNSPVANEAIEATAQAVPFNPFTKLAITELVALTGRYTKTWRVAHSVDVALAMAEFNCSPDEACFYADLKSTANSIIDRETISTVGDHLAGLVRGIGTAAKEISLNLIKADFDALKPELQNEVGKRIRDVTNKTYESATASKLLSILYAHLGVQEKNWMR
jgi:hypothetical protein